MVMDDRGKKKQSVMTIALTMNDAWAIMWSFISGLRIPHISTIQRYPYNLENFASAGRVVSLVSTRICSITPHIKDHIMAHASFMVSAMVITDCFFFPRSSITIDYL
jgi:hypothetical protein